MKSSFLIKKSKYCYICSPCQPLQYSTTMINGRHGASKNRQRSDSDTINKENIVLSCMIDVRQKTSALEDSLPIM